MRCANCRSSATAASAQLRLADQNGLQQQVLAGIEVRQHTQLLQAAHAEILRFVNDEHGT